MKVVADENIAGLQEYFSSYGTVIGLPGRDIRRQDLADADVLLVRSVTAVNAALLKGTAVRFVGSCTIGTDHLDREWMSDNGITCIHAPGCNARAVVDYVLCSLMALEVDLIRATVGIVGCGQVGGLLDQQLAALGVATLRCDPFLKERSPQHYVDLEDMLPRCDVLCLHTPLTRTGPHPTFHLMDEERLQRLKHNAVLVNAGRGAVVDTAALVSAHSRRPGMRLVLDVWENEPDISRELLALAHIATPHIAGYSLAGKWRGTRMVHEGFCRFFSLPDKASVSVPKEMFATWPAGFGLADPSFREQLLAIYDPRGDTSQLKSCQAVDGRGLASCFDRLRKEYPWRREFSEHL